MELALRAVLIHRPKRHRCCILAQSKEFTDSFATPCIGAALTRPVLGKLLTIALERFVKKRDGRNHFDPGHH